MAHAAAVSGSLSFTASAFPAGAPHDPVSGIVTFSFDNSATFFNATNGTLANGSAVQVSFSGLTLPGSWVPVMTYVSDGLLGGVQVHDLLSIGHVLNGTQTLVGTDDWRVAFNSISSGPTFREFTYTLAGGTEQFQAFSGTIAPVPEPATVALLSVGLAGVWAKRRRRA